MGITRGRTAIDGFFKTTLDLISYKGKPKVNQIFETDGFTTPGDSSGEKWKATGNVIAASQNNSNIISDANGNEFIKVLQKIDMIRKSKLDNPLMHILKKNKVVDTLSGVLSWTRATTATYVDRYGVVKTAAIDAPREETEGWLIEGASTNLLTYSSDSSNAVFQGLVGNTKNTVAASVINPDLSTQTVELSAVDGGIFRQGIAVSTSNKTYSFYIYITNKAGGTQIACDYGDGVIKTIDITAIQLNTWVRLEFNDLPKGTGDWIDLAVVGLFATPMTFYIWGRQFEPLHFATSYTPTTTAAVTRAADSVHCNFDNNSPDVDSASSFMCKFNLLGKSAANTFGNTIEISTGGYLVRLIPSNGYNQNSGTSFIYQIEIVTSDFSMSGDLALTYDNATVKGFKDGYLIASQAYVGVTGTVTGSTIQIGNGLYFGHISDLRIYDFALNADEVSFLSGK